MKGMAGLLIAGVLALLGAALNWVYLAQKSRDVEKVAFVALADDATVRVGERFRPGDFVKVEIPRKNVRDLGEIAVPWSALETVVGAPARRDYRGSELLLYRDTETAPEQVKLAGADERLTWIPINSRAFVADSIDPGDLVSFVVPQTGSVPVISPGGDAAPVDVPKSPTQVIGPFQVLSVGNRYGSTEALKASRTPQRQENLLGISVKVADGKLDPQFERLYAALSATGFKDVSVLLHPRE